MDDEQKQREKEVALLPLILPWAVGSVEELERVRKVVEDELMKEEGRRQKEKAEKEKMMEAIEKELKRRNA